MTSTSAVSVGYAASSPPPPDPAGPSPGGGTGVEVELGLQPLNGEGATIGGGVEQQGGYTTYTGSIRIGAQIGGEAEIPGGGVVASAGQGTNMAFEIVVPEGVEVSAGDLARINPFDPRTIPPGVSIRIDAGQFVGTEYEARVRHFALSEGVTLEAGVTYQVSRSADGNSATVAFGPYAAIEQTFGLGPAFGPVSVQLGRTDSLEHNALVVEQLDLSRGDVRSTGTSLTATAEYVSQSSLGVNIGPLQINIGLRENASTQLVTLNSDGTTTMSTTLYYDDAVPVTVNQTFNPDGSERVSERTYSYTVQVTEDNRQLLHCAMGGDWETAADTSLRPGETVVLTYTQAEMEALRGDFTAAAAANPNDSALSAPLGGTLPGLDATMGFAVSLVRNGAPIPTDFVFAETLFNVSDWADGEYNNGAFEANPGTAWVTNPGEAPRRFEP